MSGPVNERGKQTAAEDFAEAFAKLINAYDDGCKHIEASRVSGDFSSAVVHVRLNDSKEIFCLRITSFDPTLEGKRS